MAEVISNMEKVISMVQKLFDVEFKALSASLVERDDSLFTNQISELKGYFEKNVQNDIRRPENPSEEWFQLGEEVLAKGKLCPRLIFQVKRYRHKQYGDLFRVYASSTTQPAPGQSGYSICLFITDWEEKLLVISRYDRDVIPMQDGVRLKEGHITWIWNSGEQFTSLNPPIEVLKIRPPEDIVSLSDYESTHN